MELCLSTIVLVLIFILTLIFLYLRRAHYFFKRHQINGPEPVKIFGIFPEYKKKGILKTDLELVKEYGNVVGIYHGSNPVLLIADPDLVEEICIKQFHKFRNRKQNLDMGPLLGKSIALSNDGQWRYLRDHISEIFKPHYLERIHPNLLQSAEHLINNIESKLSDSTEFDFHELCLGYSVDALCNSLFSYNVNSFINKDDKLVTVVKKGWTAANTGIAKKVVASAVCPFLKPIFSATGFDAVPADVKEYLSKLITKHMSERQTDSEHEDLLSFLIHSSRRKSVVVDRQNNAKTTERCKLSETEIVANCLFFFLAGYDTTASAVVFTLYCLAKNPDCQDKLYNEICNNISDKELYENTESLVYLDNVLNETFRMFPAYLRFGRCVQENTIIKGVQFQKDLEIAFPVYAIHHNPDYFPNPNQFNPHRFDEENKRKRHPCSFIPFGVGPRYCFADSYAKQAIKTAVVSLLQKFKFSTSSKQQDPPALSKGFYLRPENGLQLSVEKRIK